MSNAQWLELVKKEGWETSRDETGQIWVHTYEHKTKLNHPAAIHLKIYRVDTNPDIRYKHLKAAHDLIWPKERELWHYWTERRFKAHCEDYCFISWAGGAHCGKSYDGGKLATLFWLSDPRKNGVIIASTTLDSMGARIWGYVGKFLSKMAVKFPFQYLSGNAPKILYPASRSAGEIRDTIHGMFAVAAKKGEDEKAIDTWIGRHPEGKLLLVLDEAPDLNPALMRATANLDSSNKPFQCLALGNSNDWYDLHGAISMPRDGIGSIDPMRDTEWPTTQKKGICLFFSCYESPAIHEPDEKKREKLSKILITKDLIAEKEKVLGKETDDFYRMVLGFWRRSGVSNGVVSKDFLQAFNINKHAEWRGLDDMHKVAGFDPAFSVGGDKCILQVGTLGVTTSGEYVLDYRGREGGNGLYEIKISAAGGKDAGLQVVDQASEILRKEGVLLKNVCVDANGQGRLLSTSLYLKMGSYYMPFKVYSTRVGFKNVNSFDVVIKSSLDLWEDFRKFVEQGHIRGLNEIATAQFTQRKIILDEKSLRKRLETKMEFKARMRAVAPALAHSPDEADGAALCLQAAILSGFITLGKKAEVVKSESFVDSKLTAWKKEGVKMEAQREVSGFPSVGFSVDISDPAFRKGPF